MSRPTNNIYGLKLNRFSMFALFCLVIIVLVGLLSNYLATSKPLYIKNGETVYYPAFSQKKVYQLSPESTTQPKAFNIENIDWSKFSNSTLIFTVVPYDPGKSDLLNANYRPPFSKNICGDYPYGTTRCKAPFRHWLGTNLKGDDVLSGLIHGTSVSLKIGFFSISIALFIGLILGLLAGYFQNDTYQLPLLSCVFMFISIIPAFYFSHLFSFFLLDFLQYKNTAALLVNILVYLTVFFVHLAVAFYAGKIIQQISRWKKKVYLPIDTMVSRIIEVFSSIPKLILVVALASILERSITNVILIIGFCSWADIARLVRAEALKFRNRDFITSARALGLHHTRVILKHVLPNMAGPIVVTFVFGLSTAILIESGLSFLNMGVPENTITWGKLLADGRQNFNAWWLIVFPGLAIFITVICLNTLGEKFKSSIDPTNRQMN
jgi:peptide/nickel transport system permease protein